MKEENVNEEVVEDVESSTDDTENATEEVIVEEADTVEVELSDEEKLQKELETLKEENKQMKDKVLRTAAEFDNFRKRTTKEKQGIYNEAVKDTVEKMLTTLDNFERALISSENKEDSFYVGVDMIFKQLVTVLTDMGVKEIEAVGEVFDPNLHFAVAHEESDDVEENTVTEVLQKGYKINDKVIRCAMVKVAN